jgi:hypothetical protein
MALTATLNILAAISIGNSAFLIAGAALIAIPIIIHILNRQRFRIVNWAAMEFLLRAMRKNRKRLKLEQWILLAARCLAVFLIGLALAEPQGGCNDSSLAGAVAGSSGMNVIIIDNSYSAAYEGPHSPVIGEDGKPMPAATTHLEQQKQIAAQMVDLISKGGGSVAVITAAKPELAAGGGAGKDVVKRAVLRPGLNHSKAKEFIERIEQSYSSTDIAGALQLANTFADETPEKSIRNLYILSDGTRSAWDGPKAEALKRLGPEVARRFRVVHYHVAAQGDKPREQWNHVLWDLQPGESVINTRFGGTLVSTVRGFGTGADPMFQLYMDDKKPLGAQRSVHPDPSSGPLSPPQMIQPEQIKIGGPHLFMASLLPSAGQGDKLRVDNERYRVIDVPAELSVLIVQGQVSDQFGKSSGSFLKAPLAPEEEGSALSVAPRSKTHVTAKMGSESDLRDRSLRGYHVIILCGVARLDEKAADTLAAFVRGGGALITFVGGNANSENYNNVLLPRGLVPGELVKIENQTTTKQSYAFDFDPKAPTVHRLLETFRGVDGTGLNLTRIKAFWKVDISRNKSVEPVLGFIPAAPDPREKPDAAEAAKNPMDTSRPPAITTHQLGQGTVIFVATSANPALDAGWNDLPGWDAWVQLLHEMVSGSVSGRDGWMNLLAGQPLVIPARVDAFAPKLLDANKAEIAVESVTESDRSTTYRTPPLNKPGVYSLELKKGGQSVPIAVNVPAEEADVRTVNDDFIKHALGDIKIDFHGDDFSLKKVLEGDKGNSWATTVLMILLALLGFECFMAMWFGHYRRQQQAGGAPAGEPAPAA